MSVVYWFNSTDFVLSSKLQNRAADLTIYRKIYKFHKLKSVNLDLVEGGNINRLDKVFEVLDLLGELVH